MEEEASGLLCVFLGILVKTQIELFFKRHRKKLFDVAFPCSVTFVFFAFTS